MINRLKNSDLKYEHVNLMTIILVLFKSIFQRLELYLTIIISISLYMMAKYYVRYFTLWLAHHPSAIIDKFKLSISLINFQILKHLKRLILKINISYFILLLVTSSAQVLKIFIYLFIYNV